MSTEELPLRRMAVCVSGLIYWGGVLIQARRIRKQIGRSPNLRPRGLKEQTLWFGWFTIILIWIGQPVLLPMLARMPGLGLYEGLLNHRSLALGLALVLLGYAGTHWAYAAMGNTWRIGIDVNEKTTLVSSGPYRRVRHPIYLLQMVILAGAALLIPTALSFAILITHYVCVRIKAGDEEKHLAEVHGNAYRDYLSRTGSLFPRLIRRRSATRDSAQPGIDS